LTKVTFCGASKRAKLTRDRPITHRFPSGFAVYPPAPRTAIRARKLKQLALICARALLENNKGVRRLAPAFMRESDDRYFLHGRVSQKHAFNFNRRNVFTAAYDDVFQTVANFDVTIRMHDRGDRLAARTIPAGRSNTLMGFARPHFDRRFQRNREIDLPFECVDAHHEHAHFVAYAESLPRSSADQSPLRRLEYVKVVRERRDMDEPGDQSIR